MGKEIGRSFKYNGWKISTPTLKKPVLSSSAAHRSYTSNFTQTFISSQLENKYFIAIQNKKDNPNTYDIHSCVTPQKLSYSVQATSTTSHLKQLNTALPIAPVELQKISKLTLVGKEYLFPYIQ